MKKRIKIIFIILILAIFLTISTAYKRVEVLNKSELNNLSCGWPIQYISNGFEVNRKDPPYPWKTNCVEGEWGDPVDINWRYFVFDVVFFYLLILVLFYIHQIITRKGRGRNKTINKGK